MVSAVVGKPGTEPTTEADPAIFDVTDRATLRRLAGRATPGPWFSQPSEHVPPRGVVYGPDGDSFASIAWNPGNDYDQVATAEYIAAADPRTVLALLDDLDEAEARQQGGIDVERLREALERMVVMVDGEPHYRTASGIPQQMPNAIMRVVRAAIASKPQEPVPTDRDIEDYEAARAVSKPQEKPRQTGNCSNCGRPYAGNTECGEFG